MLSKTITLALLAGAILAPTPSAQTLLGSDNINLLAWEFSPAPANPCNQPNPLVAFCPFTTPTCGITSPGFAQPGQLWGDIADDPLTDTFYLTDGRIIEQYTLDTPCSGPLTCGPVSSFMAPSFMGPITGMGFDNTGGVVAPPGTPLLWLTDGRMIAAITPGPCGYVPVFGPCLVAGIGAGDQLTDLTWDPSSGSLWACTNAGLVHNIAPTLCAVVSTFAPDNCGLFGSPLTGIAFDAGTPALLPLTPSLPTLYVTNGFVVARMDTTGAPPVPTFGSPSNCTPTPQFLSGLALTQHGGSFGFNRVNARLDTYGQSSTPGPTFGLEVYNPPAGANAWLILNFNFPGLGFFCPPLPGAGTNIWVDPTAPGTVTNLGPMSSTCTAIPLPIPPLVPVGLEAFAQFVFVPTTGPPAVDATNGIYTTVMLP
ncbi:MAG: hypothetical protein ACI9EF_003633 [Pseudohongiellaceae bacterium]|jgi:hypothetical protein